MRLIVNLTRSLLVKKNSDENFSHNFFLFCSRPQRCALTPANVVEILRNNTNLAILALKAYMGKQKKITKQVTSSRN